MHSEALMVIALLYKSGGRSFVPSALHGLQHWLMEQMGTGNPGNAELVLEVGHLKVFVTPHKIPGIDDPQLISFVIAACERRWNKFPVLRETDELQKQAFRILIWLVSNGDVEEMKVGGHVIS